MSPFNRQVLFLFVTALSAAALAAGCGTFQVGLEANPTDTAPTLLPPEGEAPEVTPSQPATTGPVPDTPDAPGLPMSDTAGAPALPLEATYFDEVAGIAFDYPLAWTVAGEVQPGYRGSVVQLTADGQPRLDVAILLWEPTSDLPAYIASRKTAWEASRIAVLSEELFPLADGRPAVAFAIQTQTGEQAYFFYTTIAERYLQLSGSGDLELLARIGHTVRPTGPQP